MPSCWWLHIIKNLLQGSFFPVFLEVPLLGDWGWERSTSSMRRAQWSPAAVVPGGLWDGVPRLLVPAASSGFIPFPTLIWILHWCTAAWGKLKHGFESGLQDCLGRLHGWVGCSSLLVVQRMLGEANLSKVRTVLISVTKAEQFLQCTKRDVIPVGCWLYLGRVPAYVVWFLLPICHCCTKAGINL